MDKRLDLHEIFCKIIGITEPDGDRHSYFDPPASFKMKYPAIRYKRKSIDKIYANNMAYRTLTPYEVVVIDEDPDSEIVKAILQLPYCDHVQHYKADNLNHDVFTLYY